MKMNWVVHLDIISRALSQSCCLISRSVVIFILEPTHPSQNYQVHTDLQSAMVFLYPSLSCHVFRLGEKAKDYMKVVREEWGNKTECCSRSLWFSYKIKYTKKKVPKFSQVLAYIYGPRHTSNPILTSFTCHLCPHHVLIKNSTNII